LSKYRALSPEAVAGVPERLAVIKNEGEKLKNCSGFWGEGRADSKSLASSTSVRDAGEALYPLQNVSLTQEKERKKNLIKSERNHQYSPSSLSSVLAKIIIGGILRTTVLLQPL